MSSKPTVALVIASMLVVSLAAPAAGFGRPVNEVPVNEVDEPLESPTDDRWEEIDAATVAMSSADSGLPGANETSVEEVDVKVAESDERVHVHVAWDDEEPNDGIGGPGEFADALAIQWPAEGGETPPIAMGSEDSPVNIWYWNGASGTENLGASGAGTTTTLASDAIDAEGSYEDGRWQVVFSGDIDGTPVDTGEDAEMALAVWDGENAERGGIKAVSEWQTLPFGGEPSGPPYELLLWTVAGLAVAGVIGATVYGVREEGSR